MTDKPVIGSVVFNPAPNAAAPAAPPSVHFTSGTPTFSDSYSKDREIAALRAEVDRLRAALTEIADCVFYNECPMIAREALGLSSPTTAQQKEG